MKNISILSILLLLSVSCLFAQKANRKPTPKPRVVPGAATAGNTKTAAPKPAGIRIGLRIEDAHSTPIGAGAQFGIVPGATFCVDPALGESYLPPNPPAGLPDLRFGNPRNKNDDCFDLGINNDFRPYKNADQADTFKVIFQAPEDGYPLIVHWDSLASHFKGDVTLRSPLNGKMINFDMKSKTWTAIKEEIPAFYIIASKPVMDTKKKK